MLRIKMCGFNNRDTLRFACQSGADAIGLNFCTDSPRYVSIDEAQSLAQAIPSFVSTVALFVDAEEREVEAVTEQVPINLLQFHGDETAAFCEQFSTPYIKAIRIPTQIQSADDLRQSLLAALTSHPQADGFLLDARVDGVAGGTGSKFDWDTLATILREEQMAVLFERQSLIIAGGLQASNALACATMFSPHALDVSSGLETSPGEKSREKIQAFIDSVATLR